MADTVERKDVFVDLSEGKEIIVNRIVSGGFFGSQYVVVLGTNRNGVDSQGNMQPQTAITARLRFDLEMAKMLRDTLNEVLNAVSIPEGQKPN